MSALTAAGTCVLVIPAVVSAVFAVLSYVRARGGHRHQ
jgi:hypothetical protein